MVQYPNYYLCFHVSKLLGVFAVHVTVMSIRSLDVKGMVYVRRMGRQGEEEGGGRSGVGGWGVCRK